MSPQIGQGRPLSDEVVDQDVFAVRVGCTLKQGLKGQPIVSILPGPADDIGLDNTGFDRPVELSAYLLRQDKGDGIRAMGFFGHYRQEHRMGHPKSSQRDDSRRIKGVLHQLSGRIQIAGFGICVAEMPPHSHLFILVNQHFRLIGTPWGAVRTERRDGRRVHWEPLCQRLGQRRMQPGRRISRKVPGTENRKTALPSWPDVGFGHLWPINDPSLG